MPYLLKGALVEYGTDLLGPLPNVVIFQFNPEILSRTIKIPHRPTEDTSDETSQSGDSPFEEITLTAHFSAADQLNKNNFLARIFGIGHQLAALENMVYPKEDSDGIDEKTTDAIGKSIDPAGKAISGVKKDPRGPMPRKKYPRILFIWGPTRVLPVIIESLQITEKQYDSSLNPIQAEVQIGLKVIPAKELPDDRYAQGAAKWSSIAKEAQVAANLATTAGQVADLIPF